MHANQPVSVRVTRRCDAPPERVFDAWLEPELIGSWMFGSGAGAADVLRIATDARVGGTFSFVVRRQGQELDHVGEYLELDRPRRLAFTWGVRQAVTDSSRVLVDIVPLGNGAELTLTHELHPDWAEHARGAEASWQHLLDALAQTLG